MKSGKLEPGAICVVIGDWPGFEENIGAYVTLVELRTNCAGNYRYWTFEQASRPILAVRGAFTQRPVLSVKASQEMPPYMLGCGCLPGFAPAHLLPIKGEDHDESLWQESPLPSEKKEKEKEERIVGLPDFARTWNCRCIALPIVRP